MPKKPVPATYEDVDLVRSELEAFKEFCKGEYATAKCLGDCNAKVKSEGKALREEKKQLKQETEAAATQQAKELRDYTDDAKSGAVQEATTMAGKLEAASAEMQEQLNATIKSVNEELRNSVAEELTSLCLKMEEEFASVRQAAENWAKDAAEALVKQDETLRILLDEKIAEVKERLDKQDAETKERDKQLEESQAKASESLSADLAKSEEMLRKNIEVLGDALDVHREVAKGENNGAREAFVTATDRLREETEVSIAALRRSTARLHSAVEEAMPTRRVEWVIRGAMETLKPPMDGRDYASWFSPRFNAVGARDLQLELRLYPQEAKLQKSIFMPDEKAPPDCALLLWGNKGVFMAYRLQVGNRSASFEKAYSERSPHGTKRFCILQDQISAEDNALRVSVEILEAVCESEQRLVGDLERETTEEEQQANVVQDASFEGRLQVTRHVNSRIIGQVRKDMDRAQCRMVKNVEWRLEQASSLPQHFRLMEAICSPPFNAAGIEGMQIMFYPSGYRGVGEGYCSLYLYCPAGVLLRCWLHVGSVKKEITVTTSGEGGACGRTNFARFQGCINEIDDAILLKVEIEEAQQEAIASDNRFNRSDDKLSGTVKLVRNPGTANLTDVKTLPSLWTANGPKNAQVPEGFHPFSSLRSSRSRNKLNANSGAMVSTTDLSTSAVRPKDWTELLGGGPAALQPSESSPELGASARRVRRSREGSPTGSQKQLRPLATGTDRPQRGESPNAPGPGRLPDIAAAAPRVAQA